MPIKRKEDQNKFIEKINKTSSYTEIINKEKRKQLNTLTCKPELIDKFCYLAEEKNGVRQRLWIKF